jgi:uncharacterized protein with von Willebrand factor type A (vWA) domain
MPDLLTDFIGVLRGHGVRVSTAEAIDAARTVALFGYADKTALRTALAAALAKTRPEKDIFQDCFDAFFSFTPFAGGAKMDDAVALAAAKEELSPFSRMVLENDRAALTAALAAAADAVAVNDISLPTQRSLFQRRIMEAMGSDALDADIVTLQKGGGGASQGLAAALADQREQLAGQVRQFVGARYELYAKARMENVLERYLLHQNLSSIEERDFERMNAIVKKVVKRINDVHSRRKKTYKRGTLDVKRTIRLNLKYNEVPFQLQWKRKKIERPDIVVLCDISRSMRQVVRFFLMLLYSLNREIVRIRTFAFCSNLAEVSHLFDRYGVAEGVARLETGYDGNILMARTDYGQALRDFFALYGARLSDRTTVIILGDGRNNFGNPETSLLKMIGERAKRVVWLNPEAPSFWGTGDSAMKHYLPFCHGARECNTLFQLERAIEALLA